MNEATRDEAVAFAASEILDVHAAMVKVFRALEKTSIPAAVKFFFEKKCRTAINNLYGSMPTQVQEHVELVVLTEMAGGPEALERMAAEIRAEEERLKGVDAGTVPSGSVKSVSEDGLGSIPSDSTNVTPLPKIPEQWPVQLGADNQLHIVKQPEKPLAKVLEFKRPEPPKQPDPPDGPSGGTPAAIAA